MGQKIIIIIFGILIIVSFSIYFIIRRETVAKTQIANPASVYCKNQGGKSIIKTAPDGSQTGFCSFSDGRYCDEWEFFRTKNCVK